jgi:hypothetical protein
MFFGGYYFFYHIIAPYTFWAFESLNLTFVNIHVKKQSFVGDSKKYKLKSTLLQDKKKVLI